MDTIFIRDLETFSVIGTLPEERTCRQKLVFNLEINTDMTAAGISDDLSDGVNYSHVETLVKEIAENTEFFLLEKLAQTVADSILKTEKVLQVTVCIDKPGAPKFARSIAVRITRKKK